MKHDEWNLRDAFREEPESCHRALMDAARSVKEEVPVKKTTFRAVLLSALILVGTLSAAIAATDFLGWTDFYSRLYHITVPGEARQALRDTAPRSFSVGPMTVKITQLLCDRHIVLSAAEASMTDGSAALYAPSSDIYEAIGAITDTEAERLGLPPETTWLEAAEQTGLPLYGVRVLIETDLSGEAMEDALWDEEGRLIYFHMPLLDNVTGDTLPVTFYLAVRRYDPATGQEIENWIIREPGEIPIEQKQEERDYTPETAFAPFGYQLKSVRAERYATGAYIALTFEAPEGAEPEDAYVLYTLALGDETGEPLPEGLNLSQGIDTDAWPAVTMEAMASLETLPETLTLTLGEERVVCR